ncbi:MAG: class F sortase [Candidatus Nomurabacteria bacterium]|jgi:sortase (surface protein transpeptidase)|nr:class F sortase [Candidatus Nomurabacteria bacterium]
MTTIKTKKKSMPRELPEPANKPSYIKLIIGGLVLVIIGAFIIRVVINEQKLLADTPQAPIILPEEEVSTDPITTAEVINFCKDALATDLCKISIPAIEIDNMKLTAVGTKKNNGSTYISTPRSIYAAGWYNGSATPWQNGITFISGHSSIRNPAPFNRLHELKASNTITLERGDGTLYNYQVASVARLSLGDANDWVHNNLAQPKSSDSNILYLMTCIGSWNLDQDTMNERVLVRATPI